jgi:branched-chain amino acid transport system substrate-binding protein
LLVLLVATILVAGGAGTAYAASRGKITGSVSNPYPLRNHKVTARAVVLNSKGKSVKGASVSFTWKIDGHSYKTTARTNSKGVASSTRSVGTATAWKRVTVALSVRLSGHSVTGAAYFVPLPEVSVAHPATVRIGAALPLTQGAVALGQGMLRGVQLAVAQANESHRVTALGLRFITASKDDRGDPSVAVTVAKQLAADPSVLGVAGHLNSGCSIPAAPIYRAANIVMVTGAGTNPYLTQLGYKNIFRNMYQDGLQGPAAAREAYRLGYRTAYVVDDSTPYGAGLADSFRTEFISLGGTAGLTASTSDLDTDFTALVSDIKSAGRDVVYYGGIYNAGSLLSHQMSDAGVKAPMMGGDGLFDPEFIAAGGRNGDMSTSAGYPASALPDGGTFVAQLHAAFPGKEVTDMDAYSYDSACVIIEAVIRQAEASGTAMVGTVPGKVGIIARVAATDLTGATGPIGFAANGDRLGYEYALYKVVGGSWVLQHVIGPLEE